MNQPPQTGKRIVSKAEYVRVEGKRAGLVISSGMLVLLGAVCVILTTLAVMCIAACCFTRLHTAYFWGGLHTAYFLGSMLATLLFGSCAYVCAKASDASTEQAEKIEAVVPFTRANTAELPASDSLLRASAKPGQEQQAVLLRAASQETETPLEQLVRAAGEPK